MVSENTGSRSPQRAQLVLIAAVLVAVAILGAVVLLNTIHATPDVSAQTDTQSVSDAERVADQIQGELHALFLASATTDSGEQLPYVADRDEFNESIESFSEEFTALASTNMSAIIDVEYVERVEGALAHQNMSYSAIEESQNATVLRGIGDGIPRLYLNVSAEIDSDIAVELNGSSTTASEIRIEENSDELAVVVDGRSYDSFNGYVEIELIQGVGEIRSTGSYYGDVEVSSALDGVEEINVTNGDQAEWVFEIAAAGAGCGEDEEISEDSCKDSSVADINPTFEINYQDPNVAYHSRFTLYGDGES